MKKFATLLLMVLLTACGDGPMAVVTSVDTFCTRVERFHATDDERAALRRAAAAEPLIVRFIRWAAGTNNQHDEHCLQPAKGA
jgi:hypothetical protein